MGRRRGLGHLMVAWVEPSCTGSARGQAGKRHPGETSAGTVTERLSALRDPCVGRSLLYRFCYDEKVNSPEYITQFYWRHYEWCHRCLPNLENIHVTVSSEK